jgi:putative transposase
MSVLDRLVLNDARWERMAGLILGRRETPGSTGRDHRMFVEAVLWIVRTGAPLGGLLTVDPADDG